MIRVVMLFLVISVLAGAALRAQEVSVKNSFWSGWKYSVDGHEFKNVGASAKGLKEVMVGNEKALASLDAYSRNQTGVYSIGGNRSWYGHML